MAPVATNVPTMMNVLDFTAPPRSWDRQGWRSLAE
jgi:hypothetical protein